MHITMSPVLKATFSHAECLLQNFVLSDSCADSLFVDSTRQWHVLIIIIYYKMSRKLSEL